LLSVASQVMVTISFTVLPLNGDVIDTSGSVLSPFSSSQDQSINKTKNVVILLMLEIYIKKNYNNEI